MRVPVSWLREFVDARFAKEPADACDPLRAGIPLGVGLVAHSHGPELEELELLAMLTDALLAEQDRPRARESYAEGDQAEER